MSIKNLKSTTASGSIALLALGISLAMATQWGLHDVLPPDLGFTANHAEPNWFVGVLVVLALLQLMRYAHTREKSSLVLGAIACLGIWFFRDSNPVHTIHGLSLSVWLPAHQLSFSAIMVGLAGWLALQDRRRTQQEEQRLTAQIQQLRQKVETLQSAQSALESKVFQRTHELHLALEQVEAVSAMDALTGFANRKRFEEVLKMEWGRAARSRRSLSVALIDVDWLSSFNTQYGHELGDASLCKMVGVLQSGVMRSSDLIARYRGGCFALLVPDTDAAGIVSIANYLCQEVMALNIPHQQSPLGRLSISVGVATSGRIEGRKADAFLMRAHAALALAKAQGRNQVMEA
jgi:diguanylate cyclase (GGDEF)-like protein